MMKLNSNIKPLEILAVILLLLVVSWLVIPSKTYRVVLPDSEKKEHIKITDFIVYYSAANIVMDERPDKIYHPDLNKKKQNSIIGKGKDNRTSPTTYLYPPHTLLYFVPLHYFPFIEAFYVWQASIIIGTFLLIALLCHTRAYKTYGSSLLAAFLIATSFPWMAGIAEGQPVMIMLLGILGGHLLAQKNHFLMAGFLLVITTFKPQLALAPALYLMMIHGKKLWLGVIVSAVATLLVCSFVFGVSIWQSYLQTIFTAGNDAQFVSLVLTKMCNFKTLGVLLLSRENFSIVNSTSLFLYVGSIIISAWLGYKNRNKTQHIQELGFALTIALTCFFSPWMHIHTLLLLILPIVYLLKYSGKPTLYGVILFLAILNPFLVAFLFPELTEGYLALNLLLWIPAQIVLMGSIAYCIFSYKKYEVSRPNQP